ncbi:MAG: hypothetical protein V3T70_09580 [Phycisphaerae bacterium]
MLTMAALLCLTGVMCETTPMAVLPDSVDVSINADPDDRLWAVLRSEFGQGEIFGPKNADGELIAVQRIVARSLRDGRVYTLEFDDQERVVFWGDDLGNVAQFSYTATDLLVDFVDAEGNVTSLSAPLSALAARVKPGRSSKSGAAAAPRIPAPAVLATPLTVAVVTSVTLDGVANTDAIVTTQVDYLPSPLGSGVIADGTLANKYYTAFVHRRMANTANFDDCAAELGSINTTLEVVGASVFAVGTYCAAAAETPPGLLCFMMSGGTLVLLETAIVLGGLTSEFPEYTCGASSQVIDASPASATIVVTAVLPSGAQRAVQVFTNLRDMADPRVLQFAIAFETDPGSSCSDPGMIPVTLMNSSNEAIYMMVPEEVRGPANLVQAGQSRTPCVPFQRDGVLNIRVRSDAGLSALLGCRFVDADGTGRSALLNWQGNHSVFRCEGDALVEF